MRMCNNQVFTSRSCFEYAFACLTHRLRNCGDLTPACLHLHTYLHLPTYTYLPQQPPSTNQTDISLLFPHPHPHPHSHHHTSLALGTHLPTQPPTPPSPISQSPPRFPSPPSLLPSSSLLPPFAQPPLMSPTRSRPRAASPKAKLSSQRARNPRAARPASRRRPVGLKRRPRSLARPEEKEEGWWIDRWRGRAAWRTRCGMVCIP